MNSTLNLETVLSTIVAKAVQLSGTDAGAIYVFDDQQREFHLRATYGMDQELIDALTQRRLSALMIRTRWFQPSRNPLSRSRLPTCGMRLPMRSTRSLCALVSARGWLRRSCVERMSSACW